MRVLSLALSFFFTLNLLAQNEDLDKVRSFTTKNEPSIYNEFISFLQIPNVATDTPNIRKNADFLIRMMNAKGIDNVQLLEAGDKYVPPVVYGEVNVPGATKTVIFYAHYDGQPVNP
ncbi:MAG: hypothetical protein ACXVBH_02960, partial [Flavisolibacter sp.]